MAHRLLVVVRLPSIPRLGQLTHRGVPGWPRDVGLSHLPSCCTCRRPSHLSVQPCARSVAHGLLLTVCCHLHSNSTRFLYLSVVDTNRSTCSLCTRAMNRQHTTSQTIFFVFSTAFPVLPSVLHVFFSDASLSPACLTDPARWSRCPTTSSADG